MSRRFDLRNGPIGDESTGAPRVSIPRRLFGPHLVVMGCALLLALGHEAGWYGRTPAIVAVALALAVCIAVRPRFVLTAEGLHFAAKVLFFRSFSYASIDRRRIESIRVGWERELSHGSRNGVAYSYRRPFLGVFLEYSWKEPARRTTLCLERLDSKEVDVELTEAWRKAKEYARVLGCPLRKKRV